MAPTIRILASVSALLMLVSHGTGVAGQTLESPVIHCDVTQPNGRGTFRQQPNPGLHGNGLLSIVLSPQDVVFRPNGPGFITRDGSLGMKFGWNRGVKGQLKIEGRRLDAPASPLRSQIGCCGYGDIGLQPSYLIFPTTGCWEVTGQVGNRKDSKLTFVVSVVKIGEGPARYDPPGS